MAAAPPEPTADASSPAAEDDLASMREQVYVDERPKEYFDRFHERTRTKRPDAMYEIVKILITIYSYTFFRLTVRGSENVPSAGPVILAPNHFSFMDHFFTGAGVRRKVQFMGKAQIFKPPLQFVYNHGGVFPVRRGVRDEDAFITARALMDRGSTICMYCEGGRSRTGNLAEKAKPGIGRVALESGAPIVPVAIYGSAKVRNWKRGQFPKVTVVFGEPLRFPRVDAASREQSQAAADEIFGEIQTLYASVAQ